jgi:hypothetical protein
MMKRVLSVLIVLLFMLCSCNTDKVPPVVEIEGPSIIELSLGEKYIDEGASAIDDVDGDVEITLEENIEFFNAGEHEIKYIAVDSAGNSAESVRKVVISPIVIECEEGITTIINAIDTKNKNDRPNVVLSIDVTLINNSADIIEVPPLLWFENSNLDDEELFFNLSQFFPIAKLASGESVTDRIDISYEGEPEDIIGAETIRFGFTEDGFTDEFPYIIDINIADLID